MQHELAAMGWHSITIWECELKPVKREDTLESLAYTLNKIFLQDRTVKQYEIPEEEPIMAATSSSLFLSATSDNFCRVENLC